MRCWSYINRLIKSYEMIDTTKFCLLCSRRGQRDLAQLSIPPASSAYMWPKGEKNPFPFSALFLRAARPMPFRSRQYSTRKIYAPPKVKRNLKKNTFRSARVLTIVSGLSLLCGVAVTAIAAGPQVVSGPGTDADCLKPWSSDTKYFQWPNKDGPYRISLLNRFIGNTWRIQMIKTAKAYAEKADVKPHLKEFKVVSTGEDLAAQIAAANNFIDSGYDAVIVNAVNPAAFAPVVKRANAAAVVLLSFDNVIESPDAITVNVDQVELGRLSARWLLKEIKAATGKLLEVRGPSGNSVDRDRHNGFHEILDKSGKKFEVIEVVGKWDDGTAQKAVADAIAIHKKFDGIYTQGGSTGTVQAR